MPRSGTLVPCDIQSGGRAKGNRRYGRPRTTLLSQRSRTGGGGGGAASAAEPASLNSTDNSKPVVGIVPSPHQNPPDTTRSQWEKVGRDGKTPLHAVACDQLTTREHLFLWLVTRAVLILDKYRFTNESGRVTQY